jgi:nitroreductase
MEFRDVITSRRSIRAYKPDTVEEAKLQAVLEAGLLAPTAVNFQPFRIIVAATDSNQDGKLLP